MGCEDKCLKREQHSIQAHILCCGTSVGEGKWNWPCRFCSHQHWFLRSAFIFTRLLKRSRH